MYYIATKSTPSALERRAARLYRYRHRALLAFVTVMALDILITVLLPRKYESRMKIMVRDDRPDLVVSADASTRSATAMEVTENAVNNEIELLRSYDLLAQAVRICGLAPAAKGPENTVKFEKAVRKLDHDLSVSAVRKSEVIEATLAAKSPESAQSVLSEIAKLYMDAHIRAHSSSGTADFFHRQAVQYQNDIKDADDRLNRFDRAHGIVAMETQKDVIVEKATDFDADLRQAEANEVDIATRNRQLRQDLSTLDKRVVTEDRTIPNQYSVERLNTMLVELRNKRTEALVKFKPDDRVVKEIDAEIAETSSAADKASKVSAVEESTDLNPLRKELESELARGSLQESGLKAKLGTLKAGADKFHAQLSELDNVALDQDNLVRERKQAEQNYLLYTQKEEEARIADALDRQKIANVVITETPTGEHIPTSPHVMLNLCLGLLLASFAGAGVVAAGNLNGVTFQIPAELEASMGIAVLGVLPASPESYS